MGICGMAATSAGWFYGTLTCPCQPSQPSLPASQPASQPSSALPRATIPTISIRAWTARSHHNSVLPQGPAPKFIFPS